MRFTREQYDEAIAHLHQAAAQLAPDGRCCAICGDSGHQAWECGSNPLLAMAICEKVAKASEALHESLHYLAGYDSHLGETSGPAKIILPDRDESALITAAKRVCASLRADSAPTGSPIAELRDAIARRL